MQIILAILYSVLGLILAIPYCLLAGWEMENYAIVSFVAPAFLFIWFILGSLAHIFEPDYRRRPFIIRFNWRIAFGISNGNAMSGSKTLFWLWTAYSFLPIIAHWGSKLIEQLGFQSLSEIVNTHRYSTPLYALFGTLALIILLGFASSIAEYVKRIHRKFVCR